MNLRHPQLHREFEVGLGYKAPCLKTRKRRKTRMGDGERKRKAGKKRKRGEGGRKEERKGRKGDRRREKSQEEEEGEGRGRSPMFCGRIGGVKWRSPERTRGTPWDTREPRKVL